MRADPTRLATGLAAILVAAGCASGPAPPARATAEPAAVSGDAPAASGDGDARGGEAPEAGEGESSDAQAAVSDRMSDWMILYEVWVLGAFDPCTDESSDVEGTRRLVVEELERVGVEDRFDVPQPKGSDTCRYRREQVRPALVEQMRGLSEEIPAVKCLVEHYDAYRAWQEAGSYPVPPRAPETEAEYDRLATERLRAEGLEPTRDNHWDMLSRLEEERVDYEMAVDGTSWFFRSTWEDIVAFLERVEPHWSEASRLLGPSTRVARTCPDSAQPAES